MEHEREPVALEEIARQVGGTLVGDGATPIRGLRSIETAGPTDLTFVDPKNHAMMAALEASRAGGVITGTATQIPAGKNAIRIDPPHLGLARALHMFHRRKHSRIGIAPGAHVAPTAEVADDASIYPGAYIGPRARIGSRSEVFPGAYIGAGTHLGADCMIHANATIYEGCRLGDRVVIHSGAVIGADGFGYTQEPTGDPQEPQRHLKIPQVGTVILEDDVEIGANTTIDRATLEATVIGRGTKIDNLVQVAHNCKVGRHCIIVALAGLSGSITIGDYVTIAGQAGMVGHIKIGDRAVVTAQAGVTKDIEEGKTVIGSPAMDLNEGRLAFGLIRKLPDMKKTIADLVRRIDALEKGAAKG